MLAPVFLIYTCPRLPARHLAPPSPSIFILSPLILPSLSLPLLTLLPFPSPCRLDPLSPPTLHPCPYPHLPSDNKTLPFQFSAQQQQNPSVAIEGSRAPKQARIPRTTRDYAVCAHWAKVLAGRGGPMSRRL